MMGASFAARDVCTATGETLRWGRPDLESDSVTRADIRPPAPPISDFC